MNRFGGGSLILLAILLIVGGIVIQSDVVAWLLNTIGILLIIGGVVIGIMGLVSMFKGNRGGSSDF